MPTFNHLNRQFQYIRNRINSRNRNLKNNTNLLFDFIDITLIFVIYIYVYVFWSQVKNVPLHAMLIICNVTIHQLNITDISFFVEYNRHITIFNCIYNILVIGIYHYMFIL